MCSPLGGNECGFGVGGTGKRKHSLSTVAKRTDPRRKSRRRSFAPLECGALAHLPSELFDIMLMQLTPSDLASLACTCKYFNATCTVENIAKKHLETNARAKNFERTGVDTSLRIFHYCDFAERAERYSAAVSLGAFHSAILAEAPGVESSSATAPHGRQLVTFGRGFHGQLGTGGTVGLVF